MKELCDFLREKRQLLFFLLFFEGALCLIYGLYGLPWGPAGYTCLVTAVVTLGFLMAGFFRWKRKRRQLLILKGQEPEQSALKPQIFRMRRHHWRKSVRKSSRIRKNVVRESRKKAGRRHLYGPGNTIRAGAIRSKRPLQRWNFCFRRNRQMSGH